jgi:hypothetical protein
VLRRVGRHDAGVLANRDTPAAAPRPLGLDQEHWREYLASLVTGGAPRLASVTLAQAGQNGRPDRLERPLQAIRYQAEADELEVVVGGARDAALRFYISTPRSIVVEELDGAKVLRVADARGMQTVIRLCDAAHETGSVTRSLARA